MAKKRSKDKELPVNDSPFFKSLRKRTIKLYFTKSRNIRRKWNQKEIYQKEILEVCLRLSGLLETLRLSRFFIEERRRMPADHQLKIKNTEFIRYHLECYLIRSTTFKDLILKLLNRVYKFGFTEKNGLEYKIIRQAEKDNNTDLLNLLEGLKIIMSTLHPIRNKIAHGGYHDDVDLILIEGQESTGNIKAKDEYNQTMERLITRNIIDMYQNELMMATLILLAYKKLYPIRRKMEKDLIKTKQRGRL